MAMPERVFVTMTEEMYKWLEAKRKAKKLRTIPEVVRQIISEKIIEDEDKG